MQNHSFSPDRPNPTSTQLWMCLASAGNWRVGHLTPWVFDTDFQLTTKPFCTVVGLPPPFPFYCIFYLPQRTPSQCSFPPAPPALLLHTCPHKNHALHLLHFSTLAPLCVLSATGGAQQLWEGGSSCPSPELSLLPNILLPGIRLFHFPGINTSICRVWKGIWQVCLEYKTSWKWNIRFSWSILSRFGISCKAASLIPRPL